MGRSATIDEADELIGDLLEAVGSDPAGFSDRESVVSAYKLLNRVEALVVKVTGSFDAFGVYEEDGARTAVAWITKKCRAPKKDVASKVQLGRALRQMPATEEAFEEGAIGAAHASALSKLRSHGTEEAFGRDEEMLVLQGGELRFDEFCRALGYWRQLADEEGARCEYEKMLARRDAYLVKSLSGMWMGEVTLDPVSGEIVSDELERIRLELLDSDRAKAKARLGRDPLQNELARTRGQRLADAFVEMAKRSRSAARDGTRPAPSFVALVGADSLVRSCELASGTVIPPGALSPHLPEAYVKRVVFDPKGKSVSEVGASVRFYEEPLRTAVQVSGRECSHEFCDVRAKYCEIDHIVPYSDGGPTTWDNARLLCKFHNRLAYRRHREKKFEQRRKEKEKRRSEGRGDGDRGDGEQGRDPPAGPSG